MDGGKLSRKVQKPENGVGKMVCTRCAGKGYTGAPGWQKKCFWCRGTGFKTAVTYATK